MQIVISETQRPPAHPFYGDSYERGLDPWHRDAFPDKFKDHAPEQGEVRKQGWFLLDAWQNVIGFIADGTVIEIKEDTYAKNKAENRSGSTSE